MALQEKMAETQAQMAALLARIPEQEAAPRHQPNLPKFDKYDPAEAIDDHIEKCSALADLVGLTAESRVQLFVNSLPGSLYTLVKDLLHPLTIKTATYEQITSILKGHLQPVPLVIPSRHAFLRRRQQEGESIASYAAALRHLSVPCKYSTAEFLSEMLRDVFVSGLREKRILDRVLEEDNSDFDKVYKLALSIEAASSGTSDLLQPFSLATATNNVNKIGHSNTKKDYGKKSKTNSHSPAPADNKADPAASWTCWKCGEKRHKANMCTRTNLTCGYCSTQGHVESVCKKKKFAHKESSLPTRAVHNQSINDTMDVYSIIGKTHLSPYMINLKICNRDATLELDSGSPVSIIGLEFFRSLAGATWPLSPTNTTFRSYSNTTIVPVGTTTVPVKLNNLSLELPIYIVAGPSAPIMGREWIRALHVQLPVQRVSRDESSALEKQFPHVFADGVGKANYTASIALKPDAVPVFRKARPMPHALRDRVEAELNRLVAQGVLEQITHSEYATPIVPVIQRDGIRICADYSQTINPQIIVPHYPIPRIEELFTNLQGGKLFAKLDIRKAYLSIPVDSQTQELLTITTHRGLYRPKRLMFGVSAAPAIWQKYIDQILQGVDGVATFFDDILVSGRTRTELEERLEAVLHRIQDAGLHLNINKCEFYVPTVRYLGHTISADGICKSTEGVAAILNVPPPTDVRQVRSFMGLVTFYAKFIPHLAEIAAPLYALTQKDAPWCWSRRCASAFEKLKTELASDRVLAHYSPELPVVLATDASPFGVGAVLSHVFPDGSERPISFASRTLNAAEKNYSQIDREALSIKFGVDKFHYYLIGRHFTLFTDHQPLVHIFGPKGHLPSLCATRLLHYALFLQNFTFSIKYRPSKEHGNADALSRLPLESNDLHQLDSVEQFQVDHMRVLAITAKDISVASLKDPELRTIIDSLRQGLTKSPVTESYSLQSGCVLNGLRVYIPPVFRSTILDELHKGHVGIVKMKALARSYVFWPGIDDDIEHLCRNCPACAQHKGTPVRPRVHHWEYPSGPWERVHMDYASYGGRNYLLIVDAYSKWVECFITSNMTADTVRTVLMTLFARFGTPNIMVSDNQTSFVGITLQEFFQERGVRHITSPPFHAASNGQVERYVSTLKQSLRCLAKEPGSASTKLQEFLAAYRRAPHSTTGQSPSLLFLGREPRSPLTTFRPDVTAEVRERIRKGQFAFVDPVFYSGQRVAVRDFRSPGKKWAMGIILAKDGALQYSITVEGSIWRRHVEHIRPVGDEISPDVTPPPTVALPAPSSAPVVNTSPVRTDQQSPVTAAKFTSSPSSTSRRSTMVPPPSPARYSMISPSAAPLMPASPIPAVAPVAAASPLRRSQRTRKPPVRLEL